MASWARASIVTSSSRARRSGAAAGGEPEDLLASRSLEHRISWYPRCEGLLEAHPISSRARHPPPGPLAKYARPWYASNKAARAGRVGESAYRVVLERRAGAGLQARGGKENEQRLPDSRDKGGSVRGSGNALHVLEQETRVLESVSRSIETMFTDRRSATGWP